MKFLIAALLAVSVGLLASPVYAQAMFPSQQQAQQHCPGDVVVWLNIPSGIYHMQGERWYGRTKSGSYACKQEADKAGDRETKNGQ
jgi:hypothetical protein